MITASHNPYHDNGIKLIDSGGYKMSPDVLEQVEAYIDGEFEIPLATGEQIGRAVDYVEGRARYIKSLIESMPCSLEGFRVAIDCANGASTPIAPRVFTALGADVHVISNEPDGFNINMGCGSTHIERLQAYVREEGLDIGFAYDGDADRCIAVDEYGNVCDVGDKYVSACMQEHGYALGGEQSGHVIFSEYSATGDGINTSLRIMQTLVETGKSLAELAKPLKIYPQLLKNVKVEDKHAVMEHEAVKAAAADVEAALEGEGRALIRASGTEPLVRVMVEAPTIELCEQYVNKVVEVIESL